MIPMCWKCDSRITNDAPNITLVGCKECPKVHDYASAKEFCPLIKTANRIIGKTIEEARLMSDEIIRVVMQDGEQVAASQDFFPNRINVSIINDKIDEVVRIG
jgi:hypothetical protein